MLTLSPAVPIYVAIEPIDLRRSFDGLVHVTRSVLGHEPQRGGLFVFFNRANTHCKLLFWDRSGYVLLYKRLERGSFRLPRRPESAVSQLRIDARELATLLEGVLDPSAVLREAT